MFVFELSLTMHSCRLSPPLLQIKWHVPTAASITEVIPLLRAVVSNTITDLTTSLTDLSTSASTAASAKGSTDDLSQLGSVALGSPVAVTGNATPVPGGL